jgi:hypothetical protein
MADSVPGDRWASGRGALGELLEGATTARAAVAFVSQRGVDALSELLKAKAPGISRLVIVARGASITDPEALLRLRDELGARVSVVTGTKAHRFHPKLWLIEAEGEMRVLSGSGNLTGGGLEGNSEQFEAWTADEDGAKIQIERFTKLTAGAIPLSQFEGSAGWDLWIEQREARKAFETSVEHLDQKLIEITGAEADLLADLWNLYDTIREAKLKEPDGKAYGGSGFRLMIGGHRGPKTPVEIISSLCRETTRGFIRARDNGALDVAAEVLAVDPTKSYHGLIPAEIRRAAEGRLRAAEEEGFASPTVARRGR